MQLRRPFDTDAEPNNHVHEGVPHYPCDRLEFVPLNAWPGLHSVPKKPWVTKSTFSFSLSFLQHGLEVFSSMTTRIPRPPPPKAALIIKRKTDLSTPFQGIRRFGYWIGSSRQSRHARFFGRFLAATLSPIRSISSGRSNKSYSCIITSFGKVGFSEKKTVSRVNHVYPLLFFANVIIESISR